MTDWLSRGRGRIIHLPPWGGGGSAHNYPKQHPPPHANFRVVQISVWCQLPHPTPEPYSREASAMFLIRLSRRPVSTTNAPPTISLVVTAHRRCDESLNKMWFSKEIDPQIQFYSKTKTGFLYHTQILHPYLLSKKTNVKPFFCVCCGLFQCAFDCNLLCFFI